MAHPLNSSNPTNSNKPSKVSLKIVTDLPEIIQPVSPSDDGDSNHHGAEIRDNHLANTRSQQTKPSNYHYVDDGVSTPRNSAGRASPSDLSIGSTLNRTDTSDTTTSPSSSRHIESRLNSILAGLPEQDEDDDDEEEEDDEEKQDEAMNNQIQASLYDEIFRIFDTEDPYNQQNVSPQTIHGFGDSSDAQLSLQPPFTEEHEMLHIVSTTEGPSRPGTAQNSPRSNGYDSESSIGAIVMGLCVTGNASMQHPTSSRYISGQSDPMTTDEDEDEEDNDYA